MIVNTAKQSDMSTIGDMQQIEATVDVKNLSFLATLLSSNLYSNPEESFIREITSNAWDSHVEAGTTDKPVIIKLNEDSITIRDYGTGLSKENFEDLYCKIGSSTKRDSNSYIGCFGLGHLSPLAVSNVVNISDYYNGTVYNYIMIKDCNNIVTTYVGCSNTEEGNGLSISVNISRNKIPIFLKALRCLTFFPNIYIASSFHKAEYINDAIIKRYKSFSVSSAINENTIYMLLGNVLYPINKKVYADHFSSEILQNLESTKVCLNFNIGDVNVTPNRESIIYSESTEALIRNRISECVKELTDLGNSAINHNVDDIIDYFNIIDSYISYDPLNERINYYKLNGGFRIYPEIKYKNKVKSDVFNSKLNTFVRYTFPRKAYCNIKGTITNSKSYAYDLKSRLNQKSAKFIALENNRNLGIWQKEYIKSLNYEGPIIVFPDFSFYREEVLKISGDLYTLPTNPDKDIIEEVIVDLYEKLKSVTTIILDKDVEDYKIKVKANSCKDTLYYRDPSIYNVYRSFSSTRSEVLFRDKTIQELITCFKKNCTKRYIVHCGRDFSDFEWKKYDAATMLGYNIIWVTSKLYKNLCKIKKDTKLINNVILDINDVINVNNKVIQRVMAVKSVERSMLYDKYYVEAKSLYRIIREFMKVSVKDNKFKDLKDVLLFTDKFNNFSSLCSSLEKVFSENTVEIKESYALYLYFTLHKYEKMLIAYGETSTMYDRGYFGFEVREIPEFLFYKWCLKNKTYFNYKRYLELKNNNIIKLFYE